ncbi:MAG: NADH:flavin oxidoreductase [Clostridiales bacterium]|nr:NADH:flavin oxidoreductase [Clostridiales bacterium]MCF8021262.1 NADH:flavin oxidoreductase [Clostridiales bacterium]
MKKFFEKINLGGIEVSNRIVRSATGESLAAEEGYVNEDVFKIYKDLAEGKVGLIITGMMAVKKNDICPGLLRIHDDDYIEGLQKICSVVHKNNSKIMAQLAHGGTQIIANPSHSPIGPSKVKDLVSGITAKEMTQDDIYDLVKSFGNGALRTKKAGFDGIQLHAAHGYLLSKFLTPYYNQRNDEYGGSLKNRIRILIEILNNVKSKCGQDYPVFIKLNSADFLDHNEGLMFKEGLQIAKLVAEERFDAIEVSGGITYTPNSESRKNINSKEKEAYFEGYAEKVANAVSIPVILVGGIRSLETIEEVLQGTGITAISLCRPLIREPGLVKRWLAGDREKSKCISCNKCLDTRDLGCFRIRQQPEEDHPS